MALLQVLKLNTPAPLVFKQSLPLPSAVGKVNVRLLPVAPACRVRVLLLELLLRASLPVTVLALPSTSWLFEESTAKNSLPEAFCTLSRFTASKVAPALILTTLAVALVVMRAGEEDKLYADCNVAFCAKQSAHELFWKHLNLLEFVL